MRALGIILSIAVVLLAGSSWAQPQDRRYEGDWYVSDQTDNVTGEREVEATKMHFPENETGYLTLTIRCSKGKPTFFVDWSELSFPDQSVVSIATMPASSGQPAAEGYVFEKSEEILERGMRATPEVSAKIVSAMAGAKRAKLTVRPVSGVRTATVEVDGAPAAWARVSRHCPVRTMPLPPM